VLIPSRISTVAHVVELAVAPVFLLAAVGACMPRIA